MDMTCDRDTCGNADYIKTASIGSIAMLSSDDFIANLLHLKCKVIQLARSQMQKEIPGLQDLLTNRDNRRGVGGKRGVTKMEEGSAKIGSVKTLSEVNRGKDLGTTKHEEIPRAENPQQSLNVETSSHASPRTADRLASVVHDPTEDSQNFLAHWIRKILTISLPFYWIIVVIGILGLASLVCGVMLGAFICTNRHHNFPFFFWSTSRVGRAVY